MAVSKCQDGKLHLSNKNKRFPDFSMDLNGAKIGVEKNGANWWNYFLCGVKVKLKTSIDNVLVCNAKCISDSDKILVKYKASKTF